MLLLGDQLIRDAGIAVFELVKNAYDADATKCTVMLSNVDRENDQARIVIEDDGLGMDSGTIKNVWLVPGTGFRKKQRKENTKSKKFRRLPLGEKGVGRFAVHKLGRKVRLISRKSGSKEVVVEINWKDFDNDKPLSEVPVHISERDPEKFTGKNTGTYIEISDLQEMPWTRRRVRALYRAITPILFGKPE